MFPYLLLWCLINSFSFWGMGCTRRKSKRKTHLRSSDLALSDFVMNLMIDWNLFFWQRVNFFSSDAVDAHKYTEYAERGEDEHGCSRVWSSVLFWRRNTELETHYLHVSQPYLYLLLPTVCAYIHSLSKVSLNKCSGASSLVHLGLFSNIWWESCVTLDINMLWTASA